MTHPSSMVCIDPHFDSSSADRPLSPVGSGVSPILLLRAAVDMEVHGGLIEARSVTNHVTLRPYAVCLAPPEGGTKFKTKLLLP